MKIVLFLSALVFHLWACSSEEEFPPPVVEKPDTPVNPTEPDLPKNSTMQLTINSTSFTATLADNATAKAFTKMLPMTINMSEMNGNEKYFNLPSSLPTRANHSGVIQNGDMMLFGSTTLVLFYQPFSTSYSYTKVATVDNPSELPTALGSGSVSVTFNLD